MTIKYDGLRGDDSLINVKDITGRNMYTASLPAQSETQQINCSDVTADISIVELRDKYGKLKAEKKVLKQ